MTKLSQLSKDEISQRFDILRRQETLFYACGDYLSIEYQAKMRRLDNKDNRLFNSTTTSIECSSSTKTRINECWREKICEWSFQVIDHFDYNREIVSISLNYLDRYLSVCVVNRKKFQLAAVTCLYLALKLYGSSSLKISSFVELSRGYFSGDHIIAMESAILRALSWHVHPPTPLNAARHFLYLFPTDGLSSIHKDRLYELKELSRFLTELSVCDFFFVRHKASTIGLAALLTAVDFIQGCWEQVLMDQFFVDLKSLTGCDPQAIEVLDCKARLKETYIQGGFCEKQNMENESNAGDTSPVCVSKAP